MYLSIYVDNKEERCKSLKEKQSNELHVVITETETKPRTGWSLCFSHSRDILSASNPISMNSLH